jgi:hypothetical protein
MADPKKPPPTPPSEATTGYTIDNFISEANPFQSLLVRGGISGRNGQAVKQYIKNWDSRWADASKTEKKMQKKT